MVHETKSAGDGAASANASDQTVQAIAVRFTSRQREFLAAHGLWSEESGPAGTLAHALRDIAPKREPSGVVSFSCERWRVQIVEAIYRALREDLAGRVSQKDACAAAQCARRMREALGGASTKPAAKRARPLPAPRGASAACAVPQLFAPAPTGQAYEAYEKRLMDSLRDLVDFSQSSAYDQQLVAAERRPPSPRASVLQFVPSRDRPSSATGAASRAVRPGGSGSNVVPFVAPGRGAPHG